MAGAQQEVRESPKRSAPLTGIKKFSTWTGGRNMALLCGGGQEAGGSGGGGGQVHGKMGKINSQNQYVVTEKLLNLRGGVEKMGKILSSRWD